MHKRELWNHHITIIFAVAGMRLIVITGWNWQKSSPKNMIVKVLASHESTLPWFWEDDFIHKSKNYSVLWRFSSSVNFPIVIKSFKSSKGCPQNVMNVLLSLATRNTRRGQTFRINPGWCRNNCEDWIGTKCVQESLGKFSMAESPLAWVHTVEKG